MSSQLPTQVPGDKLKKAILLFSELLEKYPDKSRNAVMQQVQIKLDLSPMDCEFLNKHFAKEEESSQS